MFQKHVKKALSVLMASAVIASSAAISVPVFAATTASSSVITQSYNIANYDAEREFSLRRYGNVRNYSRENLSMYFGQNDRMPTGIWISPGQTVKVYVKAESNDKIPQLMFTQHLTDGLGEKTFSLKNGINEITAPSVSTEVEEGFEKGGCMYLLNPYTESEQSANVRVYIEGGDKVPCFQKNSDVKEYIAKLREYYSHYSNKESGYHNVSELWTDHMVITLSLERAYEAFAFNSLNPQRSAEKMDSFFIFMAEFDGIEPQEYARLYNHLKVTKMAPGVGAYAAYNGVVAVPDDGWSGSVIKGDGLGWGYPHEFGHIFDNKKKVLAEVTNNVWSLKYVLDNEMYSDIAVEKPLSDPNQLSSSDTTTLWSVTPRGYTAVYMFWDLEVYHEGFNGQLDDMLRNNSCGDSTIDSYLSSCTDKEKVAAYASKITGIDLTYYFKKYGYVTSPSADYTKAVNAMNLSKVQPKIWYYDVDAYIKSRGNNINLYTKPSLSNYDTSTKTMYFNVPTAAAANHLGFEIMKDGNFVGFVWDSQFSDTSLSGTYTVNAYDRSLNKYASFTVNTSDSSVNRSVAKVGSVNYSTIEDAVKAASNNATVYLLESATIKNTITIDGKNITLMPANDKNQIVIYNGVGKKNVFELKNGASLTVKTNGGADNTLVFDSQKNQSLSYFRLNGASTLELDKGVTVRRCNSTSEGSVAGAFEQSTVNLKGCLIERNITSNRGTFFLSSSFLNSSDNTVIRYNKGNLCGGFIQAYNDNQIYIHHTQIYNNYGGSKDEYGTIRLLNSSVNIGDGTVMKNNQSDWYNLGSGIVVLNGSKAKFSGNVNITDHVSISTPVTVSPTMTGMLTIRPNADYAKKDAVMVKTSNGTLNSAMLKNISLVSNDFWLDLENNTFYLSDTETLLNESTFSGNNLYAGDAVTVNLKANGGDGKYTYYYEIKSYNGNEVVDIVTDTANSQSSIQIPFDKAGKYGIIIAVEDSSGKAALTQEKIFTVYSKLVNQSTLSATSIALGDSVTLKGAASGGSGTYQYAVYYKKKSDTDWTKVQDYGKTISSKVTPKAATNYVIRVKVKDSLGTVTNKDFSVTVSKKLTNTSVLSAESIDLGKTVTVKASATGGVSSYTYAVLYKKVSDTKWTTKQGFKANSTVEVKPANATKYDVCVKVQDSQGTIEKKFFQLTVNTGIENKSTLSADTITLGNTVTVKCNASGGSGFYNYAVYYKKTSDSKWTTKQDYKSTSTVTIKPAKATVYDICVKVKDNTGREVKKYFKLNVINAPLANNSKLSTTSIKRGESITAQAIAAGGTAPYQYAFYYKKTTQSTWTTKQDFSSNATTSIKPANDGTYSICVKVKDNTGTIVKKYFTVTVTK